MASSRQLRSQLNHELSNMGRWIGLGTVGAGVLIWFAGAILIAIGAGTTHQQDNAVINSNGFNVAFILGCGIAGFVVAVRVSWKNRRRRIAHILGELNGIAGSTGTAGAAAVTGTIIGLAQGAGILIITIGYIIWWVTAIMLIPLILAFGFFVFIS